MAAYPAGARIEIDADARECVVDVSGGTAKVSLAAAVIVTNKAGRAATPDRGQAPWHLPIDTSDGGTCQIVVYMTDDTQIGRVEDRSPIRLTIGVTTIELESRDERHGAIIAAEIYERAGKRMLRVRGDGHHHGITALCRREDLPLEAFVDVRQRGRPSPAPSPYQERQPDLGDATGSGSGIIVAPEHVVTNAHVVRGSRSQTVHAPSGDHMGRVLSVDERHDLALLHVPGLAGHPIAIDATGSSYLGEEVIAAGYPLRDILNGDLKITRGNISSLRGAHGDVTTMQFTAPIASGSSGGAVVSMRGGLAGVVCSALAHETIRSHGGTSEGVNFAIKASLALEMIAAADIDGVERVDPKAAALTPQELSRLLQRSVVAITIR